MTNEVLVRDVSVEDLGANGSKDIALIIEEKTDSKMVMDIVSKFDISKTQEITDFGGTINTEVENYVDGILSKVKSNGPIGEMVNENFNKLIGTIDSYDVSAVKQSALTKIPFIGAMFKRDFKEVIQKFDNVKDQVDGLIVYLKQNKDVLGSDIVVLDNLYNQHVVVVDKINHYIVAGTKIADQIREDANAMKLRFEETQDLFDSRQYSDLDNKLMMMERKIDTLAKRRILAIQTALQARVMQELTIKIMDDITDVSVDVISLWKTQFAIALNIENMKKANQINQNVKDMANKQYLDNANNLKELSDIVLESQRTGVIDINSLKQGNLITINIISDMRNNHKATRANIANNVLQLQEMENEIKNSLAGELS